MSDEGEVSMKKADSDRVYIVTLRPGKGIYDLTEIVSDTGFFVTTKLEGTDFIVTSEGKLGRILLAAKDVVETVCPR